MIENGSGLHLTSVRRYDTIALGLLKKSHGMYVNGAIIAMSYTHLIRITRKRYSVGLADSAARGIVAR